MRQFPVFVSAGEDRVAAVVTAPDEQPHGLVLLLAGTGRHNAIGSTLSALLSERLAGQGLASARLDYAGSGDSPGLVSQWNPAEIAATTAQARAVLDVAREALDVTPFAEVGTCFGSRDRALARRGSRPASAPCASLRRSWMSAGSDAWADGSATAGWARSSARTPRSAVSC